MNLSNLINHSYFLLILMTSFVLTTTVFASPDPRLKESRSVTGYVFLNKKTDTESRKIPSQRALVVLRNVPARLVPEFRGDKELNQIKKTFVPHFLPMVLGEGLNIENSDDIPHGVQIVKIRSFPEGKLIGEKLILNGFTEPNGGIQRRLRQKGFMEVRCNMHPGMISYILVAPRPYLYTFTDQNGQFELYLPKDLPAREYNLLAIDPDIGFSEPRILDVKVDGELQKPLTLRIK